MLATETELCDTLRACLNLKDICIGDTVVYDLLMVNVGIRSVIHNTNSTYPLSDTINIRLMLMLLMLLMLMLLIDINVWTTGYNYIYMDCLSVIRCSMKTSPCHSAQPTWELPTAGSRCQYAAVCHMYGWGLEHIYSSVQLSVFLLKLCQGMGGWGLRLGHDTRFSYISKTMESEERHTISQCLIWQLLRRKQAW